ncbi:hypothetical protein [Deinococcus sp. QL22]|nr:hypothetical protein [Deinococcus sp. QL22]UQN09393.1 hypothetical protein M1R55_22820 [Deinococcus sp. QL22]
MQPQEFAAKWRVRAHEVTEEQGYQEHYADVASSTKLAHLLDAAYR